MSISPTAPDYMSQVRGVINDLRNNYLQKAELEQRGEIESARLALGYAQLAAQREAAARQAQAREREIAFTSAQEAAKYGQERDKIEALRLKQQYDAYKDSVQMDLDERKQQLAEQKYNFDVTKEFTSLAEKRRAGERLSEFAKLAANKDYEGMAAWYTAASDDTADLMQLGPMINQASQIASSIQNVQDAQTVEAARPSLEAFSKNASLLMSSLQNYSSSERTKKISELKGEADSLYYAVRDPGVRAGIKDTLGAVQEVDKQIGQQKSMGDTAQFVQMGLDGRLDPVTQQKFDDLYNQTPESERGTSDFVTKQRRLKLSYNMGRSEAQIRRFAEELARLEMNQMLNPNYTVTEADGTISPMYRAPDLTLSYELGTLDSDNNISESLLEEISKYRSKMVSSGVANKPEDEMASIAALFMSAQNAKAAGKQPSAQPSAQQKPMASFDKMNFSNPNFIGAVAPRQGALVAAPVEAPTAPTPAPAQAPSTDLNDYNRNNALLSEVERQIKAGRSTFESPVDKKDTGINLLTLRARISSRMGQRQVQTFGPQTPSMLDQAIPPVSVEGPTE